MYNKHKIMDYVPSCHAGNSHKHSNVQEQFVNNRYQTTEMFQLSSSQRPTNVCSHTLKFILLPCMHAMQVVSSTYEDVEHINDSACES